MDEELIPADGDAIRQLRQARGLSQEQLALLAGVSTLTVGRIERGASTTPQTLSKIDRVLRVGG